jgi:PAS domain S-box-containing protein
VLYNSEKQRGSHLRTIRDTSLDLEKGIRKATKVEEALEENKRRMNILIQNLPGMVYRYNANNIWHFTYVNDKCRQITGYTYEELITNTSVTYYDLINEEDRKNNLLQIQDAIEGKKPFQLIYRIKTAQGYEKWLWEQGVGIFSDKDDELVAIEGFIIDITEQKTIEDQLNLQSYALEAAANGIVITDKEGKLLWANSAFTELTGYSVKDVMGEKLSFLKSGMYDASYYAYMWNKINSGEIWKGEIINKRKDGILYTEEMAITPVNSSENEIIYFVAIKQDITERKKAEIALSESERNFRGLFENASIGIYRSTPDGIFIMANPALLKIFGYDSFKEFVKLNAADGYIDPDKRLLFIKQLKETGNLFGFEAEWKKKDGTIIFIRETARTVKDTDGNLMYYEGTVEDITEKKKIEEALIDAKVHAEKSDQLKSEFLAQMSHEIRTPLNVILSFSSMMKEELQNQVDEEMYNAFEVIVTEGKRITRTVELILNMSELQTNSYNYHAKRINLLKDVIQKIYNTQKSVAEQKNIIYELTCNDSDTTILADEYSVNQIFSHIIENAIKYTLKGKVEINIKRDPRNNIYVDIIDTGIGISNDYLPMLFTPFSREEKGYTRNFEGNGLGLALVKKYCDLNNAEIKVTSVKGNGSIFRITFLPPK